MGKINLSASEEILNVNLMHDEYAQDYLNFQKNYLQPKNDTTKVKKISVDFIEHEKQILEMRNLANQTATIKLPTKINVVEKKIDEADIIITTIKKPSVRDTEKVSKKADKVLSQKSSESIIEMSTENNRQSRKKQTHLVWSRLMTAFTVIIAVVAIGLMGMRIAGFRTFTVMSGSMEPKYPVGSMIYVMPVNYKDLKVGDVISYVANSENTIVTHRIVEIEIDSNNPDVWRFKTKGDANGSADANAVHFKNILGTPILTIPHIGYFAHNIQRPPGIYIALVGGTILLAWTFLPGTLEERRRVAKRTAL